VGGPVADREGVLTMRKRVAWASALIVGLAIAFLSRPTLHLALTTLRDRSDRPAPRRGSVDDASGLDETPVKEVWDVPGDSAAAEEQLVALVRRAGQEGIFVSIAGARHSMGGHSMRRDGIVINMLPFRGMELNAARNRLHVQAGALWSDVLSYLNASGRSVAVMQSNNSFTVGGSISVNCHGWQANRPPIASTVESLRLLEADGTIVRCSRTENAELFSLVLGGYGLFGIVLDAELRVVPNEEYRLERLVMPSAEYPAAFATHVRGSADVGMAYGRLSVAPESFLRESILNIFHRSPSGAGLPSRVDFPEVEGLTRAMFRGQVSSGYGKTLRWQAEKNLAGLLTRGPIHRNQLLGEPARVFENRSADSTDTFTSTSCPRRPSWPSWTSSGPSFRSTKAIC
jgi:FAD binding domain